MIWVWQIWEAHPQDKQAAYLDFYREIVRRTALLVAEWQCVGWCHGYVYPSKGSFNIASC